MSEIIAGAFVRVQAELIKGFRKDLHDQIKRGIGPNAVKIPAKLDLKTFRGEIQRELRRTPFGIPVRPEMSVTKFREELRAKVRQASKGVTVTVPVIVGGRAGGAGGRTGGAPAGGRDDAVEKTRSLVSAEKLYQSALVGTITAEQRAQRLTLALGDTRKVLSDAIRTGAVEEERAALALRGRIQDQQRLQSTLASSGKLEKDFSRIQKEVNAALGVSVKSLSSENAVREAGNQITSLSTRLKKLNERAIEQESAEIRDQTRDLRNNLAARRQELDARRRGLGRSATERAALRQGARGGFATGLSALGARGATLAAGSEFLIGAAAVATISKAVKSAADLESELNVLRITARATGSEMEAIRNTSIALGRDIRLPGVSAADAAVSMSALVRAGLSVEDALDGARGTLQLATAAQIEFSEASDLVASSLNAFSLAGTDAIRVADLLTNAANESQGEITDIGIALRQSAGAASAVGVNLEDTVALLTLLSRAGLSGSDAGTSLRTAFIRLVNPTKKAAGVIEDLGLRIRDSQGNVRPEVFAEFEVATSRLTDAQQDAARAIIFGQDAFRASALIGRQGAAGFNDISLALERQGAAAELAGARAVGLSGKISALQSNLETLGTTLGSVSLGPLTLMVGGMNDLVSSANEAATALKSLTDIASDLSGGIFEDLPKPVQDFASEAADIGKGLFGPQAGFTFAAREIKRWRGNFSDATDEVRGDAEKTKKDLKTLFAAIGEGPLLETETQKLLNALDAMADKLATGDAEAQRLATSIRGIIAEITKTGSTTGIDIELRLDRSRLNREAQTAGEEVISTFRGFGGLFETQVGGFWIDKIGDGMKGKIPDLASTIAGGLSLETQRLIAEAAGNQTGQLSALRSQLAQAQRQQATQRRLVESGQRPDLEDELQATTQRVIDLQNAINSILDDQKSAAEKAASDAKSKADDAAKARADLDEAVLAVFESNRLKAQNKVSIAEATAGLDDDIKTTAFLKRLVRLQISRLKERVKTAEIRNAAFRELSQILFGLDQELDALRKQRRETMRDQIREGIQLDIAFAETTENTSLERAARNRMIKSLQAEQRLLQAVKKKSIEQKNRLKEIRNEIAEQRKELQDITQERSRFFQELSFAFLTTQQGFFANVASNLLPMGAIGNTVGIKLAGGGGTSGGGGTGGAGTLAGAASFGGGLGAAEIAARLGMPGGPGQGFAQRQGPAGAVSEAGRVGAASGAGGFSNAQAATLIALTQQIVRLLGGIDAKGKHPEGKRQTKMTSGSFDKMA